MKHKELSLNQLSVKSPKFSIVIIEGIVAILIIVWFHTGISKLIEYQSFRIQMFQSPIFHNYANYVTFGAPILEIVLAFLLIFKRTRILGMIGSFMLMSFFVWYVSWLMIYLPKLPCSCGGIVSFLNWQQHLALNIFLALISLLGILFIKKTSMRKI